MERHGSMVRAALWKWRRTGIVIAVIVCLLITAAQIRPPCLWSILVLGRFPKLAHDDCTDVTVVTAYFNLGNFEKENGQAFGLYKYLSWAQVYQYTLNPLVVYTDSEQIENMLLETRKHLVDRTRVVRIDRTNLEAFRDVEKIRQLFRNPNYPKHYPNTVIPEYPCSQHAKYELVKRTLDMGYFPTTRYIAWVDIGYFRYLTERRTPFYVTRPPGMDESKIAMTQVQRPDWSLFPSDVFRGNLLWVGGGMSVGTRSTYRKFAEEYHRSTETFLSLGLSNTDQQVIYSMYTDVHNFADGIQTQIQTYTWVFNDVHTCWWYLGYLCYKEVN